MIMSLSSGELGLGGVGRAAPGGGDGHGAELSWVFQIWVGMVGFGEGIPGLPFEWWLFGVGLTRGKGKGD